MNQNMFMNLIFGALLIHCAGLHAATAYELRDYEAMAANRVQYNAQATAKAHELKTQIMAHLKDMAKSHGGFSQNGTPNFSVNVDPNTYVLYTDPIDFVTRDNNLTCRYVAAKVFCDPTFTSCGPLQDIAVICNNGNGDSYTVDSNLNMKIQHATCDRGVSFTLTGGFTVTLDGDTTGSRYDIFRHILRPDDANRIEVDIKYPNTNLVVKGYDSLLCTLTDVPR